MTRTQFHQDLEQMELRLLSLGELAGAAVDRAVRCVVTRDLDLARQVIADDDAVDELYLEIDGGILQLLALQSPVAADLRLISAILHSCLHLERIGDQAVNVAKIQLAVADQPGSDVMRQQIGEMGEIVVRMLRTVMEAFAKRDVDLCRQLPAMDDPVDRLNRRTHLEALKLADDAGALDWGMHMNMAARALERVGDNAVDIAEQVGFLVTGDFHEYTDASHPVDPVG
jgi:phosphate transport system protein